MSPQPTSHQLLDNPSFILRGIHDTFYADTPLEPVGPDDVLIEIAMTGICGSDVHYHEHCCIGDFRVEEPMTLGHESSGVVVQLGANVTSHHVGDRVALEPGKSCGLCAICKKGQYELCEKMQFAATPPYTRGTLCRYYTLPANLAHHLPASVSFEEGAMIEPLAVGVHSVATLANTRPGQVVAVFGAGPVGLLCAAVAKALGAARVIVVDINQDRLNFASSYAATDVFLPPSPLPDEPRLEFSKRATAELQAKLGVPARGLGGVDVVVEASGAEVCIQMGMFLVKEAGAFVQVGMGSPNVQIPISAFGNKQAKFMGSFRYGAGDYPTAIHLVSSGAVKLAPLITHRYDFTDAVAAFNATKAGKGADGRGIIKALIAPPAK